MTRTSTSFAPSLRIVSSLVLVTLVGTASRAGFTTFEAAGANPAAITPTRDAFRTAIGGGTVAGANGSFGGVRREINWDGVPDASADPNSFAANFFNNRGVEFSTPGTGFLVSANGGGVTPTLFGFPNDFQAFSAQRLFTAVGSNITDVKFFVPGTGIGTTTTAFGAIFADVETDRNATPVPSPTYMEFFDETNTLIYTRDAMVAGNQGLTFLGAVANAAEKISRVRITSGLNTITANSTLGNPNDDVVVMDDFIYAEPGAVPEPSSAMFVLGGLSALGLAGSRRRAG